MADNNTPRTFTDADFADDPSTLKPVKASAARKLGDLALGFGQGAVGATKALSDAFGANNAVSQGLEGVNQFLDAGISGETKDRRFEADRIQREAKGKGIAAEVAGFGKAFATDPIQQTVQGLGSVAPFVAAQFVPGVGQSATAARLAQVGMGLGMGAGTAKGAIHEEVQKRELAAGKTAEQAQAAADAAQAYGGANTDQIALGAGLGLADAVTGATPAAVRLLRQKLGKEVLEKGGKEVLEEGGKEVLEEGGKKAGEGIFKAGAKGALAEMPVEFAQGGQEQLAANIAAQRAGYQADTWEGVVGKGGMEALASAGPGAAFGIAGRNRGAGPQPQQQQADGQPPIGVSFDSNATPTLDARALEAAGVKPPIRPPRHIARFWEREAAAGVKPPIRPPRLMPLDARALEAAGVSMPPPAAVLDSGRIDRMVDLGTEQQPINASEQQGGPKNSDEDGYLGSSIAPISIGGQEAFIAQHPENVMRQMQGLEQNPRLNKIAASRQDAERLIGDMWLGYGNKDNDKLVQDFLSNVNGSTYAEPLSEVPASKRMGLDASVGPLSAAAVTAVDSGGASPAAAALASGVGGGFGIGRAARGEPVDVTPINQSAGQIGATKRLGETPIIDVEARWKDEGPRQGDMMAPNNAPFQSQALALQASQQTPQGGEVVAVPNGFVVRPQLLGIEQPTQAPRLGYDGERKGAATRLAERPAPAQAPQQQPSAQYQANTVRAPESRQNTVQPSAEPPRLGMTPAQQRTPRQQPPVRDGSTPIAMGMETYAGKDIPKAVKDKLKFAVSRLNSVKFTLDSVKKARGDGHHLATEVARQKDTYDKYASIIADFKQKAEKIGVNLSPFLAEIGDVSESVGAYFNKNIASTDGNKSVTPQKDVVNQAAGAFAQALAGGKSRDDAAKAAADVVISNTGGGGAAFASTKEAGKAVTAAVKQGLAQDTQRIATAPLSDGGMSDDALAQALGIDDGGNMGGASQKTVAPEDLYKAAGAVLGTPKPQGSERAPVAKATTDAPARPANWRTNMISAAKVAKDMGITAKGKKLKDVVAEIDAADVAKAQPEKPVVLQNRNRSTTASIQQMQDIAARPDYGRLGFSRDFANGAPVVAGVRQGAVPEKRMGRRDTTVASNGKRISVQYAVMEASDILTSNTADGFTNADYSDTNKPAIRAIAGNGRIAGLQAAYDRKTAESYKTEMMVDAALHGIDAKVIKGMKRPVLVRVMSDGDVTADIGDISNTQSNLSLSPVEQAKNDMARVDFDTLIFGEDGDVTAQSVRQFVQTMPKAEQGQLMDTNGQPTRQAVDRLNAAIFARAYSNDQLVRLYAQANDPEARLVMSALAQVAPKMARLEGLGALDVREIVTQAAEIAVNARREGKAIALAAKQLDMAADPNVATVLDLFASSPRSNKPTIEALTNMADFAYAEGRKPAEDMFGAVPRATREQVLQTLRPTQPQTNQEPKNANERSSQVNLEQPAGAKPVQGDAVGSTQNGGTPASPPAAQAGRSAKIPAAGQAPSEVKGKPSAIEKMREAKAKKEESTRPDLTLTSYTPKEIEAQQAAQEAAAKKERDRKAAEAERQRQQEEHARVKQMSAVAADTFELGQDPIVNLTGQQDVFGAQAGAKNPTQAGKESAQNSTDDSLFDGEKTPLSTDPAKEKARAAKQKAADDLRSALGDLGDIFGKNTRLNITPEQEQKLLPALSRVLDASFRLGYLKFKDAAKFALDKITDAFGKDVANELTLDHLQGAYIAMAGKYQGQGADTKKAVIGIEDRAEIETHTAQSADTNEDENAPSSNGDLERNSQWATTEPTVVPPVQNDTGATATGDSNTGGRAGREDGGGQFDGAGVPDGGPIAGGERGNQRPHRGDAELDFAERTAGSDFSERGSDIGFDGVSSDPIPASQVEGAAFKGTDRIKAVSQQKTADKQVKPTDDPKLAEIRAALPTLLAGQQEDVFKAETRFAKPDGYGMLFTNGTGTGKTFTGLGVVKRFATKGKTNILIVVPDEKIAEDWQKSGKLLALDLSKLPDTQTAGKGIVIATYANLGSNNALATRQWDLIVADEAHSLMQSENADETTYLKSLRAIAYHPDGAYTLARMQAPKTFAEIERLKALAESLRLSDDENHWQESKRIESVDLPPLIRAVEEKTKAAQSLVAENQGEKRPRLLALSATPFAYEKTIDWANGFLFDYNEGGTSKDKQGLSYNEGNARERFMMTHFGYTMRYNKLTAPDAAKVDSGLMQRQFNTWLKNNGVLSSRALEVDADYDRRFILIESAIGNRIDEALNYLREQAYNGTGVGWMPFYNHINTQSFDYLNRRYLLEAIKADAAIPIVKKHLQMGRKVVVFHDYKKGGGFNPFALDPNLEFPNSIKEVAEKFASEFPDLMAFPFGSMPSPIDVFTKKIPDVLLVNGDEKKADLLKRYEKFQSDDSGPQVMLVQSAKNKGWSGHDTTGKHQRVLINLGQPTAPTLAIQQEGRIYRTGQVSNAIMRYMNTGTAWERAAFAEKIATRASAAENLSVGEAARALKDAFITAFNEADSFEPGYDGEGTGGKEIDHAANNILTEYDRAKSFYWANQKKTSKTKAKEGVDYFPTPEPVGLKMVQWLMLRPEDAVLEPSAGHGAIARWMPDNVRKTAIEPSNELRSRLALNMNPSEDRIIDGVFEDLAVVNKFDGIVMNPPFGVGGKMAVDHLAKAVTHLKDGGRIVALVPTGPAADKRLDKFLFDTYTTPIKPVGRVTIGGKTKDVYKGDTVSGKYFANAKIMDASSIRGVLQVVTQGKNRLSIDQDDIVQLESTGSRESTTRPAEDLTMVAEVLLPSSAFERAGTSVSTKIIVLEKQEDWANKPKGKKFIDLSGSESVNELFDRLEDVSLPERNKTSFQKKAEEEASKAEAASKAKADRNESAKKQSAQAGGKVMLGGKLHDIVDYTTNAGKVIRGAWMATKTAAMQYSERTFQKRPLGWFVRDSDFPAGAVQQDDTLKMSRGGGAALPPTITVDGVERPTTNSNGQQIAVTEEGVRNFWRWFGDSQQTDSDNQPIVYHHYGNRRIEKLGGGNFGGGLFVLENQNYASGYGSIHTEIYLAGEIAGSRDLENYLDDLPDGGAEFFSQFLRHGVDSNLDEDQVEAFRDVVIGEGGFDEDGVFEQLTGETELSDAFIMMQEIRGKLAKVAGFSAVHMEDEFSGEAIMVVAPDKIKSATGNQGTFDPNDADIRKSSSESLTQSKAIPRTPAANIRKALEKAYGKLFARLESKGLVTLAQTEQEAIEAAARARADELGRDYDAELATMLASVNASSIGGEATAIDVKYSSSGLIQGFFDPATNRAYIVSDALFEDTAAGVLMHEVGIHMAASGGKLTPLVNRAAFMVKNAKGAFFDDVRKKMAKAGETSAEEAAAYLVEAYENSRDSAPSAVKQWFKDFMAAVRAWLFRAGRGLVLRADQLTAADIAAVARANAKRFARGGVGGGSGQFLNRSFDGRVEATAENIQSIDDEAMFSRQRAQRAFSPAAKKQAIDAVQSQVSGIKAAWKNVPDVVVAFDMNDPVIPEAVRKKDQAQRSSDAGGAPEGFYYQGKVYLMASKLPTARDTTRVLFHEALGHHGLRGVFGESLHLLLRQIVTMRKQEIKAKIEDYKRRGVKHISPLVAAEEMLAEMAENAPDVGFARHAIAAIKQWLKDNIPGFDGMKFTDDDIVSLFIVPARRFVEGGNGPNGGGGVDSGIRFSRTGGNGQPPTGAVPNYFDVKDAGGRAKEGMADRLADWRGLSMQALGRRQIVDLWGKLLPQLGRYDDLVQKMDAEKNATAAGADELATAWAELDGKGFLGLGKAKNAGMEAKLAELMHDATLGGVDADPSVPLPNDATVAQKMAKGAFTKRFDALTPDAQAVYRKVRDIYADQNKAIRKALTERIERAAELSPDSKRTMIAQMDAEMMREKQGVYFPLARFGKYLVVVKDASGKTMSVSRAETLPESKKLRSELQSRYPSDQGFRVSKVYLDHEFNAARDAVGKGFMGDLVQTLRNQGMDDGVIDSVGQLYLKSLPDLSWAKHGIHRKGTPGFSQDARRAFAQNMIHGASHLAKLRYADRLQMELTDMQAYIKDNQDDDGFDNVKAVQVYDEMVKRHDLLMSPKTHPLSTALTSAGFLFYLGLSPASAAVNLSQTALLAYPIMGAKWGYDKAGAALLKASAEVTKAKNDYRSVLQGDELKALTQAIDDGTIDVTMVHDLAGIAGGEDQRVTWAMRPVMRAASFMFHHAEKFNRQATFIAAYRLARENPLTTHDQAFAEARKATYDGHFDYSAANRPRVMQGNWAKVLLLFKQYGQNMIYTLARQTYLSIKGDTPEQKREARKAISGILALHAFAAGVLGLPVVGTLLALASAMGGDDDEPWDAKVAIQNVLAESLGQKPAEVLAHGLSRLTPWDMSGRVALNSLILPDVQEGLEGQRLAESAMTAALGPVAGIGTGIAKGIQKMSQGDYARGFEDMLPVVLRNPLKAMRYATEGNVDKTGVVINDEVSSAGVVGQALGFSPSETRLAAEGRQSIYQADKRLDERRAALVRLYTMAKMADDDEGVTEAREAIARFNTKNPDRKITVIQLAQSVKSRQKRIAEAQQGVYLPEKRRSALEAGRFAVTAE